MQTEIRRHYPSVTEGKVSVIPNGFEEADFEGEVDRERSLFNVRHVGSALLASGRSVLPLLQGFMSFVSSRPQAREEARLTIVGDMDAGNRRLYDTFLSRENAADLIRTTGRVPPEEAIQLTRSADLLVVIVGMQVDSKTRRLTSHLDVTSMTGKVFEYLASGNPILVLAELGEVAELVRSLDAGTCCNPTEAAQIGRAIGDAYDDWRAGRLKQRPLTEPVRRYSRRRQAGSLADRLRAIADDPLIRARRFSR
jgi:glycosyltransferase involved in cell wall biosynthesis